MPEQNIAPTNDRTDRLTDAVDRPFDPATLIGTYCHRRPDDDGGWWQGCVVAEPHPGVYLIEWFSWLSGGSTHQTLVRIDDMLDGEWRFYDDADWMINTYDDVLAHQDQHDDGQAQVMPSPNDLARRLGMEYLATIPDAAPADGRVVVHNHVTPMDPLGVNGFRVWLAQPCDRYVRCDCGWAPHLSEHYLSLRPERQPLTGGEER